jgi:sortase A
MTKKVGKKKTTKKVAELPNSRVKIKFGKHILPPLAGFAVAVSIFGFFNSELISGKIAYYMYSRHAHVAASDSQTIAAPVDVNAPSKLTINKINITAPVIYDQSTVDESAFQKALQSGVVHYPNTALPGKEGNVVIFGHSSGQWWAPGQFKFIFTLLDKVRIDDKIFLEYQGVRYVYRVNNILIVEPTDLSVLNQNAGHTLTLITCSPVGTSSKRLIVQATQVAPKVDAAVGSTQPAVQPQDTSGHNLPSSSPSFWHNFTELFR